MARQRYMIVRSPSGMLVQYIVPYRGKGTPIYDKELFEADELLPPDLGLYKAGDKCYLELVKMGKKV